MLIQVIQIARAGTEWESETSAQAKTGRGGWGTRRVEVIVAEQPAQNDRSVARHGPLTCARWDLEESKK